MTIKKMSGSLAVAMSMLVLSAPAMAEDCTTTAKDIKDWAADLTCGSKVIDDELKVGWKAPDGTFYPSSTPIWQFKGSNGDGCEVHAKLAKQLFEEHQDPPKDRGSSKNNGFREGHGAANALLDGKRDDAYAHLWNFYDTIYHYKAKLDADNLVFAEARRDEQLAEALSFMDRVQACDTP